MTDLLIRSADVLRTLPDAVTTLPRHDILIRGKRIEAVVPAGSIDLSHARQVIDADGLLAMPGLINTHAHVPMVLFRGLAEDVSIDRWFNEYIWPLESNLQAEDVYWGTLLGLAEMIEAGVTTVADHYFYMDRVAEAVTTAGTRALLGWAVFGSSGLDALERTAQFAADFRGAADGRISTILAPHAPYTCDDAYLRAAAAWASKLALGIHIHAAETHQETEASLRRFGRTPIQTLRDTGILDRPTIIAHACGATPDDIALMARHPVGVAHCPKTYLKLAMDVTPVLAMRQAGIAVGLGTDGVVSNNTLDVWESLRLLALMQKDRAESPEVMTVAEALYIATRESAKVVGLDGQIGALEPGYLADIILVDTSGLHHQPLHSIGASLVYSARATDVQTVIVNGSVIMRDRRLLTLDKAEIVANVRSAMERLSQRRIEQRIQTYSP
jgi:5-methylthioadenosine/S-adenosylhomocysteine deaminase